MPPATIDTTERRAYRVSFHPRHGWRWWPPDGPYRFAGHYCDVDREQHVRDATVTEVEAIKTIERAAAQARVAPKAVARFIELASHDQRALPV